jgi:hypothetical protein
MAELCLSQEPSQAEIKWSGLCVRGTFEQAQKNFPVGVQFAADGDRSVKLSRAILGQLRENAMPGGKRLVDRLAPDDFSPKASSGRALVMCCALSYELTDSIRIGKVNKIFAEIGFDLMVVNFSDLAVVMSLPMRVQVIDAGEPSPEKFASLLQGLYEDDLVKRTVEAANYPWSGDLAFATAGITSVNVWDQAALEMPEAIRTNAEEHVSRIAAADFFDGASLPVIPQTKGREMVFSLMREELADASRLAANQMRQGVSFVLREPDYQIELVIPAFQTVTLQKTDLAQTVQNCSYARITLKEGGGKILYSEKHAANVTNLFPLSSKKTSTWLSYQDAMSKLFYEGIKQIRNNSKSQRLFKDCAP